MRFPVLLSLLFVSNLLFGQTIDLEKENLNRRLQDKMLTSEEKQKLGRDWRELLDNFGGYPDLPYDETTNTITYKTTIPLNGIDKKMIYQRIKQYIATYHKVYDSYFEDYEYGKIITDANGFLLIDAFKRNFWGNPKKEMETKQVRVNYTLIFTFKNNALKLELTNLSYTSFYSYYLGGQLFNGENTVYTWDLYPVTNGDKGDWTSKLSTLQNTKEYLEQQKLIIGLYILAGLKDQSF